MVGNVPGTCSPRGVCLLCGSLGGGLNCAMGGATPGICSVGKCQGTGDQCPADCKTSNNVCTTATCADGTCGNEVPVPISDKVACGTAGICSDGACAEFTGVLIPVDNFSGRNQTMFGVGEVVNLTYLASATAADYGGLQWTLQGPGTISQTGSGNGVYTAPPIATVGTNVVLRLEIMSGPLQGQGKDYPITVTPPTGAYLKQSIGTTIRHTMGLVGVAFQGRPYILPKEVSFSNASWGEGSNVGVATGFYARSCAKVPFPCHSLNGAIHPVRPLFRVLGCNITNGCQAEAVDTVDSGDDSPNPVPPFPSPFTIGDFTWSLPWQYAVGTSGRTTFATAIHHQSVDVNGTATIEKMGLSFSRAINDPTNSVGYTPTQP